MPGINAKLTPIISRSKASPPDARAAARAVRNSRLPNAEAIAGGFDNLTASIEEIFRNLRQNSPQIHSFIVTDGTTGQVLAALGEYEVNGVKTSGGYFSELHAGDPFGNSDPAEAILNVTPDGKVQIGENGWVDVLDPFGADAAWIGTQFDTLDVTGAANNGAGLIRLTVTAHTLATGDDVRVFSVGGVPNATGIFTVTVIDANHIDLQNSVWDGTYTSGGTVTRVLHVTGIANNGSGEIRVTTAVNHLYESGDRVSLAGCGNADGQWTVTVVDATHFDLNDSTFTGGYTNGTATRYFAGGNFQTIAIGPSFADYRLRAFADGSLKIKNASIIISGTPFTIVLDPTVGFQVTGNGIVTEITNADFLGSPTALVVKNDDDTLPVVISPGLIRIYDDVSTGTPRADIQVTATDSLIRVRAPGGLWTYTFSSSVGLTIDYALIDGSGNIRGRSIYSLNDISTDGKFVADGAGGITGTLTTLSASTPISLTTGTAVTAVSGPGVTSVSTGTFVTGATLSVESHDVTGGIVSS